jgi:hypothetical protein
MFGVGSQPARQRLGLAASEQPRGPVTGHQQHIEDGRHQLDGQLDASA